MEKKSLRAIARELGVSHSYLSQITHGKRPASARVVSMVGNFVAKDGTSTPLAGTKVSSVGSTPIRSRHL